MSEAGRAPLKTPRLEEAIGRLTEHDSKEHGTGIWPRDFLPIDYRIASHPRFKSVVKLAADASAGGSPYPFRFWQVESLLDQAADILERAIRDRSIWDGLRSQYLRLRLEIGEFDALNAIHKDEVKAGYYTLDCDQSEPEERAQEALNESAKTIADNYKDVYDRDFSDTKIGALSAQAGVISKVSGYSSYSGQHHSGIDPQPPHPYADSGVYTYDPGCAGPKGETKFDRSGTPDVGGIEKGELLKDLAISQSRHSLAVEQANLFGQMHQAIGSANAGEHTGVARSKKALWDAKNVDFKRRRSEAALEANEMKRSAMNHPGGAFNYGEQLRPVYLRFTRDFGDAYARLLAADKGLKNLYNYRSDLPALPTDDSVYQSVFDAALVYTRDAVRFLAGFSHLEQSFSIPVSIRRAMGSTAWLNLLNSGADPIEFRFPLREADLPTYKAIRIRGLSVYSASKGEFGPWRVSVQPPKKAIIRFADDNTIGRLNQADVPSVISGRVMTRLSQRDADTVGISSLRNISPVSDVDAPLDDHAWTVKLDAISVTDNKATCLDDLHLDLHLVARS